MCPRFSAAVERTGTETLSQTLHRKHLILLSWSTWPLSFLQWWDRGSHKCQASALPLGSPLWASLEKRAGACRVSSHWRTACADGICIKILRSEESAAFTK